MAGKVWRMLDASAIRPASAGVQWSGSWAPRDADQAARVARLPAIQRMLLTTDGTVTTALATIAGEPVKVHTLGQGVVALTEDDDELALWAGGKVLERRVLLSGADSGTPLLYGASRIVAHRLAREARDALVAGTVAIGLVLRAHEIETFRVPLRVGIGPAGAEAAVHLGPGLMCQRSYAIRSQGRPLMVVHEQFPAAGFGADR
jgi:chorismate-pyruvate lyase